jgi:hypothetical protein
LQSCNIAITTVLQLLMIVIAILQYCNFNHIPMYSTTANLIPLISLPQAYRGQPLAPRAYPAALRSLHARSAHAVRRAAIQSSAGRALVRSSAAVGSRVAASASLRALGSLGPTGLIIRGHALVVRLGFFV